MAQIALQETHKFGTTYEPVWQSILRTGLIAGGITFFMSVIGMIEAFNEREVINDWLTLGQILLYAAPIFAGYIYARRTEDADSLLSSSLTGLLIGLLASIPIALLVLFASNIELRDIFVNITRDLMEILTFDLDNRILGTLYFMGLTILMGLIGTLLAWIPRRPRTALLSGVGITLAVGVMGELVTIILEQIFSPFGMDDVADLFFRRDVLEPSAAIGLLIISTGLVGLWIYRGDRVREAYSNLSNTQRRNLGYSGNAALGIFLLLLPWILGTFLSEVITNVGLYVLMGLGLNIAIGLAGLLDLGYVTNFAVGAYIMAIFTTTSQLGIAEDLGLGFLNFWMVLPICVLAAMLTGFIFALPVLRMRGDYLAIATLGFGQIIEKLAVSDALRPYIGGAQGVLAIPNPIFFGYEIQTPQALYYLILGACAITLFVTIRLNNSRIGRQWMSLREDEDVAAAMGINTARSKLLAFTLSAATGGLAGAIFAAKLGTVFPQSFNVLVSINALSLIIVGGLGSTPGIVLGAIVLIGMPELLREFQDYRFLLYGALLVFMMVSRPEGLWPSQVTRREMRDGEEDPVSAVPDGNIDNPTLNDAPPDHEVTVK